MVDPSYDRRYPAIEDLRRRARARIPRFAFDYLDGGCNEDVNLHRNTAELHEVQLRPRYLAPAKPVDLRTELFGHTHGAPFGIAPIGLQGLIWPGAASILARAAREHDIPFVLSTVSTISIEEASELTDQRAWFQLYHPTDPTIRDDILRRAAAAGLSVLVLLCDVPSFGFRPRDIRNGLSMPPRMTLGNVLQMCGRPGWAWKTLADGRPEFATLRPYLPGGMSLARLGAFMDEMFDGRLDVDRIAAIRDVWPGRIVLKGVVSEEDAELAVELGLDGIIVSNHGGRQLDVGTSSIAALQPIARRFGDKITVMMDSGIRSGPDIARTIASGAEFAFLGRAFMYSVAALGARGGDHLVALLRAQLEQVLTQLSCATPSDLPACRVE